MFSSHHNDASEMYTYEMPLFSVHVPCNNGDTYNNGFKSNEGKSDI